MEIACGKLTFTETETVIMILIITKLLVGWSNKFVEKCVKMLSQYMATFEMSKNSQMFLNGKIF